MQWLRAGIPLLLAGVSLASEPVPPPAPSDCSNSAGTPNCQLSVQVNPKDGKAARRAFERGLKLEKSDSTDEAYYEFGEATRLAPENASYLMAHEITRQRLVGTHLARGNSALAEGRQAEAVAEFSAALTLDPANAFTQQRLLDAMGPLSVNVAGPPQVVASSENTVAKPIDGHHDIHFRGDARGLLTAIASSYGVSIIFDDSLPNRHVNFNLENADFSTAMQAASEATKSFCVALDDNVLFAALDSAENHRTYDRMGMRSFYIPGAASAAELNEVVNSLRTIFEFRLVTVSAAANTITIRGPVTALETATQFLGQLNSPRPEVLIDLQVLEVSHTYARNIGLHVPNDFNLFNIPAAALTALGGQNIQDLINQLIASGGINQAGNETIAALLAQLQGQGNSIFSQPLATFGGGLTLMGLSLDTLGAVLSLNESSVKTLEHVTLRASQQKDATFKLGSRFPVLNGTFAPLSNNPAIAGVIGNQSFTAPFPSVNYEDLGLTLKAKPLIHNNSDVALDVNLQFRGLAGGSVNGVPVISNREFVGGILLKDGEPAAIAGMVTESDQKSLNGLPTFAQIPGFGVFTSQNSNQEMADELLILMTPHVVRSAERTEAPEIWMSR